MKFAAQYDWNKIDSQWKSFVSKSAEGKATLTEFSRIVEIPRTTLHSRYHSKSPVKDLSLPSPASPKLESKESLQKEVIRLQRALDLMSRNKREYVVDTEWNNEVLFGVISDTHFGSLYSNPSALEAFFKILKSEGVKTVLHSGDWLDGHKIYEGQEFELKAIGLKKQLECLTNELPQVKGITIHGILGNHDSKYHRQNGVDLVDTMQNTRSDLRIHGTDLADVCLKTKNGLIYRVRLLHPDGGTPYAISYKSQKVVEAFSGGDKPHALLIGHLHKADHLPCNRNVQTLMSGTFTEQTPFMQRKSSPAHVGGWIVRATSLQNSLTSRFSAEFVSFYKESNAVEIPEAIEGEDEE